jgi:hypothetical protein
MATPTEHQKPEQAQKAPSATWEEVKARWHGKAFIIDAQHKHFLLDGPMGGLCLMARYNPLKTLRDTETGHIAQAHVRLPGLNEFPLRKMFDNPETATTNGWEWDTYFGKISVWITKTWTKASLEQANKVRETASRRREVEAANDVKERERVAQHQKKQANDLQAAGTVPGAPPVHDGGYCVHGHKGCTLHERARSYCTHCRRPGHDIKRCWNLHPKDRRQGGTKIGSAVSSRAASEASSSQPGTPALPTQWDFDWQGRFQKGTAGKKRQ